MPARLIPASASACARAAGDSPPSSLPPRAPSLAAEGRRRIDPPSRPNTNRVARRATLDKGYPVTVIRYDNYTFLKTEVRDSISLRDDR